jgi:hypothetical protein
MENEMRGVFKTTDGGRTWTQSLRSAEDRCQRSRNGSKDPNTLYAAAWERQRRKWNDPRVEPGFNESGMFKTTDAGRTWTRLTNGLPPASVTGRIGIAVAPSIPTWCAFYDNYDCDTQAARAADAARIRAGARPVSDQRQRGLSVERQRRELDARQRADRRAARVHERDVEHVRVGLRQHPRRSDR